MRKPIDAAWKSLYHRYSRILGMKKGDQLAQLIDDADKTWRGKVDDDITLIKLVIKQSY